MIIAFTGHRDCLTDNQALQVIYAAHPNAKWLHGGAEGFDTQVNEFATERMIPVEVIRPDYEQYPPKIAPLKRNEEIVNRCDKLVACYDGRTTGGTVYTIKLATVAKKEIVFVNAKKIKPRKGAK